MHRVPYVEPTSWPRYLPAFELDAVHFSTDGTLWVQRTTEAGGAPVFDLFNRSGQLERRVSIPRQTRLVGFGKNSIYVIRKDQYDLEYLEKYSLPDG